MEGISLAENAEERDYERSERKERGSTADWNKKAVPDCGTAGGDAIFCGEGNHGLEARATVLLFLGGFGLGGIGFGGFGFVVFGVAGLGGGEAFFDFVGFADG